MANIQNVRMGPCTIIFNGVDCGHTLGGVKGAITRKLVDLKVDKYGDSPIDKVLTDVEVKVTAKVAEPVVSVLKEMIPEGTFNTGGNGSQLGIGAGEGASMRAFAGLLTLHPYNLPIGNQTEDFTIYLAVPTASPTLNWEVSNQKVFDLEFDALVTEAYQPGRRLAHFGPINVS